MGKGNKNRQERRWLMRRRLEDLGFDHEEVERRVWAADAAAEGRRTAPERIAAQDAEAAARRARHAAQEAELDEVLAERPGWDTPDDSRFRPARPDPIMVGVARATGQTAKAARRGSTITRWQHGERSRG